MSIQNNKPFAEIFKKVRDNSELDDVISYIYIKNITVLKKSEKILIEIISDVFLNKEIVAALKESVYVPTLPDFIAEITIKYSDKVSFDDNLNLFKDYIVEVLSDKIVMCKGLLTNCIFEYNENKLSIKLQTKSTKILQEKKCDVLIQEIVKEHFDLDVKVVFVDLELDDSQRKQYFENRQKNETIVADEIIKNSANANKSKESKKSGDKSQSNDIGTLILGKELDSKDIVIPIIDIENDNARVVIVGEILKTDFKELKDGRYICSFSITDFTSTILVKIFAKKEIEEKLRKSILPGKVFKIKGDVQYDSYTKDVCLMPKAIMHWYMPQKVDNAEVKRVELHLHTKMSSMDAVSSAESLINRAIQYDHTAIAITDHGVVQAYPEAFQTAKNALKKNNKKIKIIYGVECYLANDPPPFIFKQKGQSFDDEIVVFDVETTGLDYNNDYLIEIGAVKLKDGHIIDEFSTFVNPLIRIPSNIVTLTKIEDDDVKDAPEASEAIKSFIDFAGDAPLVAHNANFDIGFIRYNARKCDIPFTNTYIDTLELSRKLFPDFNSHKLNILAENLNIGQRDHHRAADDARVTGELLLKMFTILKDKNIDDFTKLEKYEQQNFILSGKKPYHTILLVKNLIGLKNLYKLVSYSHLNTFYKKPQITRKSLIENREGILVGTACEAGELFSAIMEGKSDAEIFNLARFYDYFEIQPIGNNQFLIRNGTVKSEKDLQDYNMKIVALADKMKKKVVATCDTHFLDPKDAILREIIQTAQKYDDAKLQAPLYFRNTEEMLLEFQYLGEKKAYEVVVTNTNYISNQIEDIAPIPTGKFPPKIEGDEEEIKEATWKRVSDIYGDDLPSIVRERIEKELNSIIKNGFAVMYITARKLVLKSLSDGYLVGSRGSVGSSFIAFLIGITEVNSLPAHYICGKCKNSEFIIDGSVDIGFDLPDKNCPLCGNKYKKDGYDIPFETFLGFEGDKDPDIDLNFSGEYQSRAHKYTEELFGEDHVFRAGTISGIAEKTAQGYIKGYIEANGIHLPSVERDRLASDCEGIKKTTGQHPGGIMVVPRDKDIYDFSPIQRPADQKDTLIITTHFDYNFLHESILKLDILGHDDPTVIRMLQDITGVDPTTIEIGEKITMGIFSGTDPIGVAPSDIRSSIGTYAIPEFGTKFVRQILSQTKPTTFSELIRISGLSHGIDVWLNNAQSLIASKTVTLSEAICCRDDIMIYLIHKGLPPKTAFKIMEAVRKGKGLTFDDEKIMKENDVPNWYIDSCKKIKYMFPKAHAAAYVMMAFRIAWFKVNYPMAFYAAYYTVRAYDCFDAEMMTYGKEKVIQYIDEYEKKGMEISAKEKDILSTLEVVNEMYARGINMCRVDLYKSNPLKFLVSDEGIIPPLRSLTGLGPNAAISIAEAREKGEFLSKDDIIKRSKAGKSIIEILDKYGCLDGLTDSNQLNLF